MEPNREPPSTWLSMSYNPSIHSCRARSRARRLILNSLDGYGTFDLTV